MSEKLIFQVDTLPDLSLNKYQTLANTGIGGVLKRHESLLRQWHGICGQCNVSIHLLYIIDPRELIGQRLKLFVLFNGEHDALELIKPLITRSPLSDFYKLTISNVPDLKFSAGATLLKKERVADLFNPLTGKNTSVYYVPAWKTNSSCRLIDLFNLMETISQAYDGKYPCAYRIDLFPVSDIQRTRQAFEPVLKKLRGDSDIKILRESNGLRSDDYARDISREYEDWLECIETEPHFRVNIYAFANTLFQAKVLLTSAGSEALTEGDYSIAQIRAEDDNTFSAYSRINSSPADYTYFASETCLDSWPTTFTLDDVKPFFRLPTLFEGETIEIPKETAPAQVENGLYLGKDTNGYPVYYALKNLPRHAFFTGMPGCGKTNTMLHIATQLHDFRIPFLVMEPAKKEYRELLGYERMRDIHLFSPHLMSRFPLKVNPLEFPQGVQLSEHISALLEVFQGTFLLEGPTYKFLSNSIQNSYKKYGWSIEDVNTPSIHREYPTLQDVFDNLKIEIDASSYDAELKGNVRAFLQVRLGGLMERDAGDLFNVKSSTIRPGNWLSVSAIIELEMLPEQAKNFFVLLVTHYILESLRAQPAGGVDSEGRQMPVRHVIFIEEAHNIIAPTSHQTGSDTVDPKISATAYIVKMLAEVRALRESIIIADQLPTALAPEVTKNTGLKVVHRLTAQDDREQIGSAISASDVQLERMAAFTVGKAFIYHEKTQKAFEVQIAEWKKPKVDFDHTRDAELYHQLAPTNVMQEAVQYAVDNWIKTTFNAIQNQVVTLVSDYRNTSALEEQKLTSLIGRAIAIKSDIEDLNRVLQRMRALWTENTTEMETVENAFRQIEAQLIHWTNVLDMLDLGPKNSG